MKSYKKILLTLLIAVLGMGMAQAQFRWGIKAGVNLNSLNPKNMSESFTKDNRCGVTVGLMTEFQVPLIGLCFDLSAMYTRMNSDFGVANEDEKIGKDFLEIPLNLKYKFGLPVVGNVFTPYLFTGPDFAIKLNKNTLSDIQTKTCQVAWNVGIGFEIVKHLQISGSYGFGVNNIAKHAGINTTGDVKLKNNYWTITAAYLF